MLDKFRSFIKKYYPNEIQFLFALFIALFSLFIFIQIADEVTEGDLQQIDEKILLMLRDNNDPSRALGPERLEFIVRDITALGSFTVITLITLFVVIFLLIKKEYRSVFYVLSASVGGAILLNVLKFIFARERPDIVQHLVSEISMSFPSGHSTISAVVYLSLAVLIMRVEKSHKARIFIISVALFLTFIVGVSRLYLGVHYPTDVIAGWSIGLFWALFVWLISSFIENRKKNSISK